MAVCVDPLMPVIKKTRKFPYNYYCHMFSDIDDLGELLDFADNLGLKISWLQERIFFNHFDLTKNKREEAVKKGAKEVTINYMVTIVKMNRERKKL